MRTLSSVLAIVAAWSAVVLGHHSFAAYYFEDQSVTLEGQLVDFEYTSPHAWVHFSVPDAAGAIRRYSAEWSNPNRLSRDGITKDTLKAGDRIIVTGSPGRTPSEYRVHLKKIERPADGWRWAGGRR